MDRDRGAFRAGARDPWSSERAGCRFPCEPRVEQLLGRKGLGILENLTKNLGNEAEMPVPAEHSPPGYKKAVQNVIVMQSPKGAGRR
jgi:hypothetical protein